jgi:hypothetical protein
VSASASGVVPFGVSSGGDMDAAPLSVVEAAREGTDDAGVRRAMGGCRGMW